jgi:hypothetical protein
MILIAAIILLPFRYADAMMPILIILLPLRFCPPCRCHYAFAMPLMLPLFSLPLLCHYSLLLPLFTLLFHYAITLSFRYFPYAIIIADITLMLRHSLLLTLPLLIISPPLLLILRHYADYFIIPLPPLRCHFRHTHYAFIISLLFH